MSTGALDAAGIWQYGEDDLASPFSTMLNLGQSSTSTQVAALQAKANALTQRGTWTLATTLTVSSGVFTLLNTATAIGTPTGMTNSGGAITVTSAGVYEVQVQTKWGPFSGGSRRSVTVTVNVPSIGGGGTFASGSTIGTSVVPPTGSLEFMHSTRTQRVTLAAGDTIRVFVFHDAGVSGSITAGSTLDYLGQTIVNVNRIS